jgi:SAM-dependent methyltransferase
VSFDAAEYRATSRERWETAAGGWAARREELQRAAEPVSRWLVDAIDPQPGQLVLELAAGLGDTGFLAAQRGARLISTDGAEAMVEAAKARAAELGLVDVEFKAMEAEWIDLETASVDAVLCRWGYMLLADPETALRETRRVLRPGGRLALAVWDEREHNPWVGSVQETLEALELAPPPAPGAPGMFALAPAAHLSECLYAAGFSSVGVDAVDLVYRAPSFDDWWEYMLDMSPSLTDALAAATPEQRDEVLESIEARLAPFRADDGSLAMPGRSLVAVAEA